VTGEEVPDPAARIAVYGYAKPKAPKWPEAEFIVGNPSFIGNKRMRDNLGDGFVEALWKAYPKIPQSADLMMFWWKKAALAARGWNAKTGKGTRRFGLITTNSITMIFNCRVTQPHLEAMRNPLSFSYAIPDHPWVDTLFRAAVRIGMSSARERKPAPFARIVSTMVNRSCKDRLRRSSCDLIGSATSEQRAAQLRMLWAGSVIIHLGPIVTDAAPRTFLHKGRIADFR
jgi:hypothetical protein